MMKSNVKFIGTLILACISGIASFYITRGLNTEIDSSPDKSIRGWLTLTNEQDKAIHQTDSNFDKEASDLSLSFINERQQLARLLDIRESSDEQILAQVERVIGANNALIRRVVGRILSVRKHLAANQHEKLMILCSNLIRGRVGRGRLLRGSPGDGNQRFGSGRGRGRGQGRYGKGRGMGYGRRRRQGRLSRKIDLTLEQIQVVEQLNPGFEAESSELAKTVSKEHEQLALLLETLSINDNDILQQLEKLLEARVQLERLTSRHVLLIRPHLSPEQQKILVGLSANCGRRWDRE